MENKIDICIKELKPCTKALMKLSYQNYLNSENNTNNNLIFSKIIFKNEYHR